MVLQIKRSWARRCRAARLEALADGPEIDAGSAVEVRVSVRVYRGRCAVHAELLVGVRREVADRVDRDPELERDLLLRHASREAIERRALTVGQRPRVRGRRSPHELGPLRPAAVAKSLRKRPRGWRGDFVTFAGVYVGRERALSQGVGGSIDLLPPTPSCATRRHGGQRAPSAAESRTAPITAKRRHIGAHARPGAGRASRSTGALRD
jgi:hypothetical protein